MDRFRKAIHACQLIDLGFIGIEYTWTDNRDDEEESCEETVSSAWSKPAVGLILFQLYKKIQFTKCALLAWQREVFGFAKAEIAKDTRDGIEDTVVGYFHNIFQSRGVLDHAVQEVVGACSPRVTTDMNEDLFMPYSEEEICVALFQMYPSKVQGPDVSCLANLDECAEVQHILDVFFQAFGQEVNLGKISIAFSANVGVRKQQKLASFLGV
ncbi:hypothetical protein ACFX1Q_045498 [Malus domestica]